MTLKKWYFAINENGLVNAFDQVNGAVRSARKNTTLTPYCLVDGAPLSATATARLDELKAEGVNIIRHSSSYIGLLYTQFREAMLVYSGHWLRIDIPQIEQEDDFVFYSDIDVVFLKDPASIREMPSIIACAPEHRQDDFGYFNSGVMVMNLPALRATADRLRATVTARLPNMQPHDDQGALNDCYRNEWDRLPNEWNWKPYWGTNPDAKLIHFHGPKPGTVRDMLDGNVSKFGPEFEEIFNRSPAAYREYLRVFDSF